MITEHFQIETENAGARLDAFLAAQVSALSRSRLQDLIREGHVTLNGLPAKPGARLRAGDAIALAEPPPRPSDVAAEDIALEVLFEDADLIVLNKPAGLVVHPAAGNWSGTLVNALLHHCGGLSTIGGQERPGIVHRLDKETSGCLVVAKNDAAHENLAGQFAGRSVVKIYLALVKGAPRRKSGTIDAPIGRHRVHRKKMAVVKAEEGRAAKTDYRVLRVFAGAGGFVFSLVECRLHTGRTHQIRVHLKHLGFPLLGDEVYGVPAPALAARQMLHAWKLGFAHPRTGAQMNFQAPVPPDFLAAGVPADPAA